MKLAEAKKIISLHFDNEQKIMKLITTAKFTSDEYRELFESMMKHPHTIKASQIPEIGEYLTKLKDKMEKKKDE